MAKNAAQQRIEFNFFTLDTLTGGHLLGDMAINRSAEARRSRERLLNTVAEFLQSHFEDAEEYEEVKVSPASNGDDSAVVTLFQGAKLTEHQMDELVTEMTHDALAYWEENPDATPFYDEEEDDEDDREDNPSKTDEFRALMKAHTAALRSKKTAERAMRDAHREGNEKAHSEAHYARLRALDDIRKTRAAIDSFDGGGRSDNPGKSGLSLYWTAVGAAVGAAVVHFKMKPKQ